MKDLVDFLFPFRCPFCKKISKSPGCINCISRIDFSLTFCLKCGYPRAILADDCLMCRRKILYFSRCRSLGFYIGQLKEAIGIVKFKESKELLEYLVNQLVERCFDLHLEEHDGITYVPASRERLSRFGLNQSYLMAQAMKREIGLPVLHLIKRTEHLFGGIERQTLQSLSGRKISAIKKFCLKVASTKVLSKTKRIILVDDVITTGSTINSLSKILLEGGAKEITVLALAHTPQK